MSIPIDGDGRFRSITLTVDTEADIGPQVVVARAADFSWKQLEPLFGKSRQRLHELAEEARAAFKPKEKRS